jgi:chromosome partitioning protein
MTGSAGTPSSPSSYKLNPISHYQYSQLARELTESSRWLARMGSELLTERMAEPDEVYEHAPKLAEHADVVIADGPAGMDELTRALLMVCDLALVPCGPSPLDLEASQLAILVIRQARTIRKGDLLHALFIPNKLQANTTLSHQLLEATSALGIPAVQNPLRYRQVYAVAAGQGQVVWQVDGAPGEAVETWNSSVRRFLSMPRARKHISAVLQENPEAEDFMVVYLQPTDNSLARKTGSILPFPRHGKGMRWYATRFSTNSYSSRYSGC